MIDPKRTVIISMFCGAGDYNKEKEAVEQTWGKDAVDAGFTHIFYSEVPPGYAQGVYGNTLYVNCNGNRYGTYEKTALAMKYVEENFDYDFIVKTNVSTYVNVEMLKQLLEYKAEHGKNLIYGNRILYRPGWLLCVRGDFTVIDRQTCRDMLENVKETKTIFEGRGSDDHLMYYLMYGKFGRDFCKRLMTIPSDCRENYDYSAVKNACAVRLKTSSAVKEKEIARRMYKFHSGVKNEKRPFKFVQVFNNAKVKYRAKLKDPDSLISYANAIEKTLESPPVQRAPYGRIAVYTCITGGYDKLKPVLERGQIFDFICFTDSVIPNSNKLGWKIKPIPAELKNLSNVKKQRVIKACPHKYLPEYKVSLWIDGIFEPRHDLYDVVNSADFSKTPIWSRPHPKRDCIYDEIDTCEKIGIVDGRLCESIRKRYVAEKYPPHHGLTETNIMLRLHSDPKCVAVCEDWASEIVKWSHRDQLSFEYVCWKRGVHCMQLKPVVNLCRNKYFNTYKHKADTACKDVHKDAKKTKKHDKPNVYGTKRVCFFPA